MKYRYLLLCVAIITALTGCGSNQNIKQGNDYNAVANTVTNEVTDTITYNIADNITDDDSNNSDKEIDVIELDFPNIEISEETSIPSANAIDSDNSSSSNEPNTDNTSNNISDNVSDDAEEIISENESNDADEMAEMTPEISKPDFSSIGESATFSWDDNWPYADHSMIHTSSVTLYKSSAENRKNKIIAINAGHGTKGGSSVKTLCHPDGSPKVTGGSTGAGATTANAISAGMTFPNGTPEATVTLKLAMTLKNVLLNNGYDVLMIRESEDTQIDNVARTVFANNLADCHISLHYDSTENNKGFFVIGVPDIASYKAMEPVASHYEQHNALANALITGAKNNNIKLSGSGFQGIDLTQTSYSTIPSVDVEVGDKGSDYSDNTLNTLSQGILNGLNIYFGF